MSKERGSWSENWPITRLVDPVGVGGALIRTRERRIRRGGYWERETD